MPTIAAILESRFRQAIQQALGVDADPIVVPAQNDKFGDYQANFAMGLSKTVSEKTGQKTNPRQVAEQVKSRLDLGDIASEVSIAGPGFINVRLSPDWLSKQLQAAGADDRMGIEPAKPQTVIVDYSGPNVAKELHVGHIRSTIIGDAIVRVLSFLGHKVIRQNHIGDWGTQFGMLIAHLIDTGAGAGHIADLEAFYRAAKKRFDEDPAFADRARQTVVRLQGGDPEILALWRAIVDETRRHYQPLYGQLGVLLTPEDERGESAYNPILPGVVAELTGQGLAVQSEGATVIFTDGPDKPPLIIEKSGGGYLYNTTDLAALRYRTRDLKANRIIYCTDNRQILHFQQVFTAATMAGWASDVSLEHVYFGSINGPDNKPYKTRSGETVKLKELLDEAIERALKVVSEKNPDLPEAQRLAIARAVGIGGVKYFDMARDRTGDYVFDWDKVLALDGNTAPYLQYAHARICSIFRKAAERGVAFDAATATIQVESPFEIALARQVLRFEDVIALVARELKPHHLCNYLYELATMFSGFFENCPVLQSEEPLRTRRLALCAVVARTLAKGLDLLGIEHPDQM